MICKQVSERQDSGINLIQAIWFVYKEMHGILVGDNFNHIRGSSKIISTTGG